LEFAFCFFIFIVGSAKILTRLEKLYTLRLEGSVDDADKPNTPASWCRVTLPGRRWKAAVARAFTRPRAGEAGKAVVLWFVGFNW